MNLKDYNYLINKAITYMKSIDDPEHNYSHLLDVVSYSEELLKLIPYANKEVVILSAYWHDVARINGNLNHEENSANMLKEELQKLNVSDDFINECVMAIKYHKWNMTPTTLEGKIVRDADKLGFIGINRWEECIKTNTSLEDIIELLPRLRNELLLLDESRLIFDRDIVKIDKYIKE